MTAEQILLICKNKKKNKKIQIPVSKLRLQGSTHDLHLNYIVFLSFKGKLPVNDNLARMYLMLKFLYLFELRKPFTFSWLIICVLILKVIHIRLISVTLDKSFDKDIFMFNLHWLDLYHNITLH